MASDLSRLNELHLQRTNPVENEPQLLAKTDEDASFDDTDEKMAHHDELTELEDPNLSPKLSNSVEITTPSVTDDKNSRDESQVSSELDENGVDKSL